MKRIPITLLLFLSFVGAKSQQDPQYTQYMYNLSVINPAYTTNERGLINFGALYRSQWQNVEGAPETFTFFAHATLSDKVETGISIIKDEIGDGVLSESNINADFAYILQLDSKSNLALGLKGGITSFETNFNNLVFPEFQEDDAFNENINSIFPTIGVGAFYNRSNFYVGVSAPNLLTSKHIENQDGVRRIGSEEIHLFFTSGYVYTINPEFKLKPSIMTKMVEGSPISLDTSVNMLFNNKFETGLSYRWGDAVSAMFNVSVMTAIRIGYAYDYTLSNLGSFSSGSHEILVLFDLDLLGLKKGYDKSPRFY
ncbi:type IX secretion system membrane protein PorP/SprF [Allomuricauda sp.]|uniref:PorP/SprF family type IX secretion system membrane protein n=1 Tax=Flagellimonas alginolytica TaxID=3177515 RepID=UPI0025F9E5BA|nr:type IX secretion system membrane protein PorP/SprF [Allomuricauda sp.]